MHEVDKMISIIVPVYNVESFLNICVKSILAQTFKNFELILIDDGSTDGSQLICDNLGKLDSRIVIIHQANKGVSYSRNIGIKKAKGKWITFVDSDDWLDENYLQLLISYCKNDDVDIVTSGLIWWYSESNINKEILNPSCCLNFDNEDDFIQFLTQPLITSPVGKLYRRDILISNGVFLDESLSYGEDRDFNARLSEFITRGKITDICGYYYRKNIDNSLSTLKRDALKSDLIYWNNIYRILLKRGFLNNETRRYICHRLHHFINDNLHHSTQPAVDNNIIKGYANIEFLQNNYYLLHNIPYYIKALIINKKYWILRKIYKFIS